MHVVKVSQPFFNKLFKFSSLSSGQTASVHTLHMPKPVITFVFKVLYKMYYSGTVVTHATFENVRVQSATQCTCFGTFFTHAQTCDNVRVQKSYGMQSGARTANGPKTILITDRAKANPGLRQQFDLPHVFLACPN